MMVTSMAKQEAIERFIRKVNTSHETLGASISQIQQTKRMRSSPSDHHHIAATARSSYDLTEWLGEQGEDPAIEVSIVLHPQFSSNNLP